MGSRIVPCRAKLSSPICVNLPCMREPSSPRAVKSPEARFAETGPAKVPLQMTSVELRVNVPWSAPDPLTKLRSRSVASLSVPWRSPVTVPESIWARTWRGGTADPHHPRVDDGLGQGGRERGSGRCAGWAARHGHHHQHRDGSERHEDRPAHEALPGRWTPRPYGEAGPSWRRALPEIGSPAFGTPGTGHPRRSSGP